MSQQQTKQYINISSNMISGYNQGLQTAINLAALSTGSALIGLNYSTTMLGFEFLPNPADNGIFRYRYEPKSTITILSFDGPNMFINVANITAKTISVVNQFNNVSGLNMFIDPTTNSGSLTVNSNRGITRIQTSIDSTQQGFIKFFFNDSGLSGTFINASTVKSQYIAGSIVDATSGLVLHPENDLSISSVLNMDINGNLYWNGAQINNGGSGQPPTSTSNSFTSSFNNVYTSTLQTTTILIRGANVLSTGILRADSSLTLYWNGEQIQTGAVNLFASTVYKNAQITNISSLHIITSTIQGNYNQPSLPAKWVITGKNTDSPAPVYMSLNDQTEYLNPTNNGLFSGGINAVYGNIHNGLLYVVGNDSANNYNTIQWSVDGRNWNKIITNNPFQTSANTVFFANNTWIIGGSSPLINTAPLIWSSDGYNFYPPTNYPIGSVRNVYDLSHDGNIFFAAQDAVLSPLSSLIWSRDGKDWNFILSGGFSIKSTAVGNDGKGMWVACGQTGLTGSVNRIQWSMDGLNWNNSSFIPNSFGNGNSVKYANGQWHVGGSGTNGLNTILISIDGKTWSAQTTGIMTSVNKINYLKDTWYAAGQIDVNGNNGLLTSKDGYNWAPLYISTFYSAEITNIYYLENVLIGASSLNLSPSTTIYVPATMSSYTVNTTNFIGAYTNTINSNTTNAIISSLTVSTIIAPNYVQVQNIQF